MAALDNAILFRRIEELAVRDGLTGLYNRRHFADLSAAHLVGGGSVAGVMVDIDHFKKINDSHGHGAGDQVIATVARRLAANLREGDIICRYGGEEFAVLLPDTSGPAALAVANRLHAAVSTDPITTDVGRLPVTISVGLAVPDRALDLSTLLNQADEALYQAKRTGRNRVAETAG